MLGVCLAIIAPAGATLQARAAVQLTVSTTADVVNGDVSSPAALVANPGPDGISLREAVTAANATAGSHAITFASSLAGKTITPSTSLPAIVQDNTTLLGLTTADGQPAITLDAQNNNCCGGLLAVQASGVVISHLRIANVRGAAIGIAVRAGEPGGELHLRDVRIEQNVLDNNGQPGYGLWIGTGFNSVVTGATLNDIRIAGNVIRGFLHDGINVGLPGNQCSIEDLVIEDNTFSGNLGPGEPTVELDANYSDNRILRTRILRNSFVGNWAGVHLNGGVGLTMPNRVPIPASGNAISSTVISQNTFVGNQQAIAFTGGAGAANATGNAVVDTEISNNLFARNTPYGAIGVDGGGQGASGNRVDAIRIVNDTIAYNDGGVSIRENSDGGVGNHISNVDIRNTVFWLNNGRDIGGSDVFRVPLSIRASIVKDPEFANGNIVDDPRFVSAQDFHLQAGSPAIDAGTSDGAPAVDLEDRVRSAPDIGAYEFGAAARPRLSVSLVPFGGGGTVTSMPAGISCPGVCSAAFDRDASVTLTANPAPSSQVAWSGACSGSEACTVKMDAAKTVSATFARITHVVSVIVAGKGRVTSSPAGIACSRACKTSFPEGTAMTLKAKPLAGYVFVGWTGACRGKTPACSKSVSSDLGVAATFARAPVCKKAQRSTKQRPCRRR